MQDRSGPAPDLRAAVSALDHDETLARGSRFFDEQRHYLITDSEQLVGYPLVGVLFFLAISAVVAYYAFEDRVRARLPLLMLARSSTSRRVPAQVQPSKREFRAHAENTEQQIHEFFRQQDQLADDEDGSAGGC